MADDILKFQCGREAALCGQRRDGRMSKDWLEGFDMETAATAPRGPLVVSDNTPPRHPCKLGGPMSFDDHTNTPTGNK